MYRSLLSFSSFLILFLFLLLSSSPSFIRCDEIIEETQVTVGDDDNNNNNHNNPAPPSSLEELLTSHGINLNNLNNGDGSGPSITITRKDGIEDDLPSPDAQKEYLRQLGSFILDPLRSEEEILQSAEWINATKKFFTIEIPAKKEGKEIIIPATNHSVMLIAHIPVIRADITVYIDSIMKNDTTNAVPHDPDQPSQLLQCPLLHVLLVRGFYRLANIVIDHSKLPPHASPRSDNCRMVGELRWDKLSPYHILAFFGRQFYLPMIKQTKLNIDDEEETSFSPQSEEKQSRELHEQLIFRVLRDNHYDVDQFTEGRHSMHPIHFSCDRGSLTMFNTFITVIRSDHLNPSTAAPLFDDEKSRMESEGLSIDTILKDRVRGILSQCYHYALMRKNRDIVRLILDSEFGIDVNYRAKNDERGDTALIGAAWNKDLDMIRDLCARGANPYLQNGYELTLRKIVERPKIKTPELLQAVNECERAYDAIVAKEKLEKKKKKEKEKEKEKENKEKREKEKEEL